MNSQQQIIVFLGIGLLVVSIFENYFTTLKAILLGR